MQADSKSTLIHHVLDHTCEKHSGRVLFKDASGKQTTYGEAREFSSDLAKGLILGGFAAGDRVGLLGERNSSSWCMSYVAILRMGGVVVPLDSGLKAEELATMLRDCGASGVICSMRTVEQFKKVRSTTPELTEIVSLEPAASYGVPSITDLARQGRNQHVKLHEATPDDLAVLIYTSGTTGKPKGVMLSHENIVSDLEAIHKTLEFTPDDIFLSVLPLHHTFECTCGFLAPMSCGSKVVYARSFKSTELIEDMRDSSVTIMCGVPLMFEKMCNGIKRKIAKSSRFHRMIFNMLFSVSSRGLKNYSYWGKSLFRSLRKKAGLDSIRLLVSGGAALPEEVGRFFNAIGLVTVQGYGLSETSPVLSVNPESRNKFSSIGPPLHGVELRIDDPDDTGRGEIIAKGPMVMMGYYNNPEATAEVLREGWFFTGDVGWIDDEGYVHITGRSKNVIVSAAGKNIYPEEIEAVLDQSPYIMESLVLGRREEGSNVEEVTAVIVPDRDFLMQAEDLHGKPENRPVEEIIQSEVKAVCSRLADFKRIKKYHIRDDELPKTSTRKIKRFLEIDTEGNLFEKQRV